MKTGKRLGGYEIVGLLGAGSMGEVYRARDLKLSRDVAVKVLPDQLTDDAERLERFEREALTASSLSHPNIVHVYALGEENGQHFVVMELVDGKTLRELSRTGLFPSSASFTTAARLPRGSPRLTLPVSSTAI